MNNEQWLIVTLVIAGVSAGMGMLLGYASGKGIERERKSVEQRAIRIDDMLEHLKKGGVLESSVYEIRAKRLPIEDAASLSLHAETKE